MATRKSKTVDARTRTAYHESGHAVLGAAINDTPRHVSIRPNGDTLGRSGARMSAAQPLSFRFISPDSRWSMS